MSRATPSSGVGRAVGDAIGNVGDAVGDVVTNVVEVVSDAAETVKRPLRHVRGKDGEPDRRNSRWDEHRQNRRGELIEAAIAAVREHGAGVGMDQIAAHAKTSKPVIYRYFADRDELLAAVGQRVSVDVLGQFQSAVTGVEEPRELVRAAVDCFLSAIEESPQLYLFISEPSGGADFRGVVRALVTTELAAEMRRIGLDPTYAEPAGSGAVGFATAVAEWWIANPGSYTRADLSEYLTTLLWAGVAGIQRAGGSRVDIKPPKGVFPKLAREADSGGR